MDRKTHWDTAYATKGPKEVSWYQLTPNLSLELIEATGIGSEARIIDVGGGASALVDRLVERGFARVTVLDVSPVAMETARSRLGDRAAEVTWLASDITAFEPAQQYDLWHDRAVFHFLTDRVDRERYMQALNRAVCGGGHVIISTFALDGPPRCSGLDVMRYEPKNLHAAIGANFSLQESRAETHLTPWGKQQKFIYCRFTKSAGC